MSAQRNHERRPENVNFSISLPREIKDDIDRMAANQHRSRSNMMAVIIENALHPGENHGK